MDIHLRIKNSANRIALKDLKCSTYKVLMYLSTCADEVGRCYPSVKTIAKDCDLCDDTVYSALQDLCGQGYMHYLKKAFYDHISGKHEHAVYQVSPNFLEIAVKNLAMAEALWRRDFQNPIFSGSNQQQNHVPEASTIKQLQNQQQQPTSDSGKSEPQEQTANRKPQKQQREPQRIASQRSLPNQNSAIVKKYTNPISIIEPLPDELSEQLAQRVNTYKIPMPMARGFVHKYGYAKVEQSANYFEFARTFQAIGNAGGFFRSILEHGLYDEISVDNRRKEFDDYLES